MNAPDAAPVALEARSLAKRFHAGGREVQALRDVSFRVRHGIVTGVVGPDGAGKTTLLRLAAGLLAPASGSITVLGMDASRESLRVQSVLGYMPQRFGLYEDLSVQENLDLYAALQGVPGRERPARYAELMHMTGLERFLDRLAGRLSGGMKQKLGLACTLVRAPRLLLLDEPTVGVDPVSRRELWAIVYGLVRDEGMSVLLSTAYLDEAERCDEVVLLHDGSVLAAGEPARLTERMHGRAFAVTAPVSKRDVLARVSALPGVIDGVIQADHVRVVTERAQTPDIGALLRVFPAARIAPVPPRFEDGFVALLRETRAAPPPSAASEVIAADAKPGAVMIEVRDVKRRFGDFYAVDGISFDVRRGEVFGLLGPNGAGKSTTFRMLCGLLPASAGTLRVAGVDLRRAAAAARGRIGYMSQKFSLYGNLSVRQNLEFFARVYGLAGGRHGERVDWALSEFELAEYADATSADLPLGYKQRLALACALMHEPDILFLDEPTSGVDPLARREFWERINALARAQVTVLVTTHFMEEAEYCDRLAIIAAGKLLAVGAPGEIKAAQAAPDGETTMEDAFIRLIEAFERSGQPA
jgi:ABC-2 type transport system ATP-binding protein